MDQVACPRCTPVAAPGTPGGPVCSASPERGVSPEAPEATEATGAATPDSGWALPAAPAAPLPMAAVAPPPPEPPDSAVQWLPEPMVPTAPRENRPEAGDGPPGGPSTWLTQPVDHPVAATWPAPQPVDPALPAAPAEPPAGVGPQSTERTHEGGRGWSIRVREELGHMGRHPGHTAIPAVAGAAGAMPMYGGGTAAAAAWPHAQPLPPAPWERRARRRSGAAAGLGAALVGRIIGVVVAATVGIVAFGHHNWLNNLAHGGTHDVSAPAIVGGSAKVLGGPLTATAADITQHIGNLSGVRNAVAAYYGSGTGVPDYYLFIVSGNTQGLSEGDMLGYLRSDGPRSGVSLDQAGATAHTVKGISYTCSPYTLTVQRSSVAGRLCAWVTYNDAGVLFSYRSIDDVQMVSITDAARTAANG